MRRRRPAARQPEIYGHKEREAEQSINFVTCHDGFTLNDLVSYDQKHNEANGEDNRDGANDNRSWNCGVEGPTDDPAVEKLRNRQVKNFLTVTMLSLGVPMILMGDEVRRTPARQQQRLLPGQRDQLVRLDAGREACRCAPVRETAHRAAAAARRRTREQRVSLNQIAPGANKAWHGVKLNQPDWSRLLAQPGVRRGAEEGRTGSSPDPQCILGAARVRAAASERGRGRIVAAMDRHRPGLARRHRRMADRTAVHRSNVSGRSALRSAALRIVGNLWLEENSPPK